MNRRKPIKKDYFAIFSGFPVRWLIRSGLFIIVAVALIWIFQSVGNSSGSVDTAMGGEDIFAVLALIGIPLAILFAILTALEKFTGISCISGVEWVGKNTLKIIDWGIVNVKKWLGIKPNKTNHRITPARKEKAHKLQSDSFRVPQVEPNIDRQPDIDSDPVFSDFHIVEETQSTTNFDLPVTELENNQETEQQRVDLHSEPRVLAINENTADNSPAYHTDSLLADATAIFEEKPVTEIVPLVNSYNQASPTLDKVLPEDGGLEESFDEFETELNTFFQDNENVLVNESNDLSTELGESETNLASAKQGLDEELGRKDFNSEILANETDYMIRALQASEDNTGASRQDVEPTSQGSEIDLSAQVWEEGEDTDSSKAKAPTYDEPDFMIKALQAAKGKIIDSISGDSSIAEEKIAGAELSEHQSEEVENESSDTDTLPKKPDFMISALQAAKEKNAASIIGNGVEKQTENTPSYPSMFDQAEQTAASIISSFSERFSRSFKAQEKPEYQLPAINLLEEHQQSVLSYSVEELDTMSRTVERVLKDYKVIAEVAGAYPGPIITRFELSLAPGVKVSRVSGLAKDLARAMLVTSVRVVEIIEGTPYIGLEIPNQERELVSFREIISSEQFQQAKSPLTLALGKDVSGQTVVSDLAKMPHLLVAGTTGSGKSVAINTMILSMLYKATPDQVRMIMVDPKMLELSIYEGIPHLLTPVVTDMKEAQNALRWAVAEMERRYKLMSKVGVRNLAGYNQKVEDAAARGETIRDPLFQLIDPLAEGETFPVLSTLPHIVIVIDELADMMMIVGKKVEELIARLAQKARAAGIHLILATQRPSVDVLTGLIKANVPTRISFQVSSRIDSRTILDQGGAEALLGNGDMLFLPSGTSVPTRSHGAFVGDEEVHAVVDYLKSHGGANYIAEITQEEPAVNTTGAENVQDEVDALYDDAVSFVMETGRASISSVQRRFKVGYNRAARMIDQMEEENIVSEPEGNGSRRVLDRE